MMGGRVDSARPVQTSSHSTDTRRDDWQPPRHRTDAGPSAEVDVLGELENRCKI